MLFRILIFGFFLNSMAGAAIAGAIGSVDVEISPDQFDLLRRVEDGKGVLYGDIIVFPTAAEPRGSTAAPRAWPRGEIIYEIAPNAEQYTSRFVQACERWTVGTGLRCVKRAGHSNYINVVTHYGEHCSGKDTSCSALGMQEGGQSLYIYIDSWRSRAVEHEIGHALGMIHEHNRPDRDEYVYINWSNIKPKGESQFARNRKSLSTTEYDYKSIMHYDNCAFSIFENDCYPIERANERKWAISPVPCAVDQIGGNSITELDLQAVRMLYAGPIVGSLIEERSGACGTQTYNEPLILQVCGPNCAAASNVDWIRRFKFHNRYCEGDFMTEPLPGDAMCRGRRQEYIYRWDEREERSDACNYIRARIDEITECGCSRQDIKSLCSNFSSEFSNDRIDRLLFSSNKRERTFGAAIKAIKGFFDGGYIDGGARARLTEIAVLAWVRETDDMLSNFECALRVELTLRRLVNTQALLSVRRFESLAAKFGLSGP